jgi:hypothetical protein
MLPLVGIGAQFECRIAARLCLQSHTFSDVMVMVRVRIRVRVMVRVRVRVRVRVVHSPIPSVV